MDAKEKNLKKLARTPLLMNFVKKTNGSWDHQGWMELCASLEEKGYTPVDFDAVGELLEQKKEAFLSK